MSQNDFTIANQSFPAFRADLNSALQALATNNSGGSAPSTTFANMWWYDTSNNIMYIRNEDNDAWIKFAELDQANDKFVLSGTLQLDDGTVSAPALTFNSDTNMGIYRGGTDILKFVTAGTDAVTIDASQNVTFAGTATMDGLTVSTDSYRQLLLTFPDSFTSKLQLGFSNFYLQGSGTTDELTIANNSSGQTKFINQSKTSMLIDNSNDISFYEDTGTTPKLFWDASAEGLGIGTTTVGANALIVEGGASYFKDHIYLAGGLSKMLSSDSSGHPLLFGINLVEKMRIDTSGNLLVGKTSASLATAGCELRANGQIGGTRSADVALALNRLTLDGDIALFYKDGSPVGSIGSVAGTSIFIDLKTGSSGIRGGANSIVPNYGGVDKDNLIDLGTSGVRFDDVYATNGTIQTSDRNEKQDIEELSDVEQRVAVVAKGLMRKFRWIDSVAEKGDNARTHFGIIAQDLQDAFTAEGLDASKYAMFTSNTWWELDGKTYETEKEAPEGATEKTRLGVRYNQLLAFIISAI